MSKISENYLNLKETLPTNVHLIAVSKTKPNELIQQVYDTGHRAFGENKVQEMCDKAAELPKDIQWHMIGHLQTNKVKYIVDFVHLIHSVDSKKLLKTIYKEAKKIGRKVDVLLQVKIASEETKYGLSEAELIEILDFDYKEFKDFVSIKGLMGMASFTEDETQVKNEFNRLQNLYNRYQKDYPEFEFLSMGMSGDYPIAISCGSNMIRVGSAIFGERNYH